MGSSTIQKMIFLMLSVLLASPSLAILAYVPFGFLYGSDLALLIDANITKIIFTHAGVAAFAIYFLGSATKNKTYGILVALFVLAMALFVYSLTLIGLEFCLLSYSANIALLILASVLVVTKSRGD